MPVNLQTGDRLTGDDIYALCKRAPSWSLVTVYIIATLDCQSADWGPVDRR